MTELYRPSAGEHPITPPPELLDQWCMENNWRDIAIQAAQWGADQELEACCEWLAYEGYEHEHLALRDSRRPNPPSLKEQALEALEHILHSSSTELGAETIRRALEQLPDAL